MKQDQYLPLSLDKEVVQIYAVMNRYFDAIDPEKVKDLLESLYTYMRRFNKGVLDEILQTHELSKENEELLKQSIEDFVKERA